MQHNDYDFRCPHLFMIQNQPVQ